MVDQSLRTGSSKGHIVSGIKSPQTKLFGCSRSAPLHSIMNDSLLIYVVSSIFLHLRIFTHRATTTVVRLRPDNRTLSMHNRFPTRG